MKIKEPNPCLRAAVDLGLTNIDILIVSEEKRWTYERLANQHKPILTELEAALRTMRCALSDFDVVAITGGQYRLLPEKIGTTVLLKVGEVDAIGRGGLHLAGLDEALVISAGSGTAAVAARIGKCTHISGSAVGGGTLQGLGRLLLGTADALEIDLLAQQGDANAADLTLLEALGGTVGSLPPDANAVNFGKLARQDIHLSREDMAAALVRLVGQVIAVIAINAARAEKLDTVVITGHLADLSSVRKVFETVASYYNARIVVPANPGFGTVIGALLSLPEA